MAVKKELRYRVRHNSMHLELYYEGGGQVPESLKGMYTDSRAAEFAIMAYHESKTKTKNTTAD